MRKLLIGLSVPFIATAGLWFGSASGTAIARPAVTSTVQAVSESTQPDTDSIQQGDQTSADTSPAKAVHAGEAGATETNNDGEAGDQSSDGPGGHQDPAGDVNHECTGDCQE